MVLVLPLLRRRLPKLNRPLLRRGRFALFYWMDTPHDDFTPLEISGLFSHVYSPTCSLGL